MHACVLHVSLKAHVCWGQRTISGIWSLPSTVVRQAGSLLFLLLHAALSTQAAGPGASGQPSRLHLTPCLTSTGITDPHRPIRRLFWLLFNRVSLCSPSWPGTHTYTNLSLTCFTEMGLASASHKSWRSNSNRETCVYSYPSSCFRVLVLIILVISLKIILIILF